MTRGAQVYVLLIITAALAAAQPARSDDYDVNYIGPRMADPVLQHSKETYVLFGCSYCHGLYLVARGEATDLMHSSLVGRDENANLIGPLLRAGIPQTAKLSPMPQFSDLSDQQISDIAKWIHYARQQGRYKELVEAKVSGTASSAAGRMYFEKACVSCHSAIGDLAKAARGQDPSALKSQILRPKFLAAAPSWKLDDLKDVKTSDARRRHLALLENYSAEDLANLMAYLQNIK